MRLYLTASGERGGVQKGANEAIKIKLTHDLPGHDWRTLPSGINEIEINFWYNNGKPRLSIILPKSWSERIAYEPDRVRAFEYVPEKED